MSGMLSTISNVLTTAVKSQFQTYLDIESCDDFAIYQQNRSSYKQQKLCYLHCYINNV